MTLPSTANIPSIYPSYKFNVPCCFIPVDELTIFIDSSTVPSFTPRVNSPLLVITVFSFSTVPFFRIKLPLLIISDFKVKPLKSIVTVLAFVKFSVTSFKSVSVSDALASSKALLIVSYFLSFICTL